MRLLPWDYGVRNLARRPVRTALTALGLALVVFLLLLVVGFVRGLELSLQQSGDPEVVLLHNANAAENLENSSIADEVPALARTEFAPHLVKYGETRGRVAGADHRRPRRRRRARAGPTRRAPRRGPRPRVPGPPAGCAGRGQLPGPAR